MEIGKRWEGATADLAELVEVKLQNSQVRQVVERPRCHGSDLIVAPAN